jgi:1-acyl-sn-glycerol-3-phosphate acyltransferase
VLCLAVLKLIGWKTSGAKPDIPKYVIIAAPHTSNFDLPLTLFVAFALKLKVYWMGKEQIFNKPFGTIMKWLGGIPVERGKSNNLVAETVEEFKRKDRLVVLVPPEGTRKKVNYWKTGFYYIAQGAGVPIVCGFLDYKRKTGGIGTVIYPTGNIEKDMGDIQNFYKDITGRYPLKTAWGQVEAKKMIRTFI